MTEVIKKSAAELVCVMLEVHIWSGRRNLERTDLVHANPAFNKLPEKDLVSLGSTRICDPEDIKKFQTVKGKAERLLRRAGLPILGAIGVPADKFTVVHDELVKLQAEFNGLSLSFIAAYDASVATWKATKMVSNPEYAHLFDSIPTAIQVAGRISFDFHPYRISAPADDMKPELNERFEHQMTGLKGELMSEVAMEASKLMTDCLMGDVGGVIQRREYVTPKTLGPLRRAAQKLRDFVFLDGSIGPLADLIDETLKDMPMVGQITGANLLKIWSLARILSSPADASMIAARAAEGDSMDDFMAIGLSSNASLRPTTSARTLTVVPELDVLAAEHFQVPSTAAEVNFAALF